MMHALVQRNGAEQQKKLSDSTVAICGLGGLGSTIAVCLARAGVGRLILTDFDCVDLTNLNRQQYKITQIGMMKTEALSENLLEIAPYTELVLHTCRITDENLYSLLKDADIICEAFDQAEEKAMLVNNVSERFPEKYLVAASGMAGLGPANDIQTKRITDRFFICGDGTSEISAGNYLYASRVMVCAAHQAHTVLRIIAEKTD